MEPLIVIIRGCLTNNRDCQKQLYERYYGYALKIVFRYIRQFEEASDVVNDGFVKIFRSIESFEWSENELVEKVWLGWIKRIMINTAIDAFRKSRSNLETANLPEYIWDIQDKNQRADSRLLYKELICQVKKLPPSYRLAFNMYVVDGFSHQEIADSLGISVGTSKSNLAKARILLKKFLGTDIQAVLYKKV